MVKTMSGASYSIEFNNRTTVGELVDEVAMRSGRAVDEINLVYNGQVITANNQDEKLVDLGMERGSTVIMALRVRGGCFSE